MRNSPPIFDVAAAARRSWEEATPAELEEMLKPEREAYGIERGLRGALSFYLINLHRPAARPRGQQHRHLLRGGLDLAGQRGAPAGPRH